MEFDGIESEIDDLVNKLSDDKAHISYAVIKFGDIGPQPLLFENTEKIFEEGMEDVLGTQLGIYLSLMISKGKQGVHNTGLHGPFPWTQTPDYNLLAFSFLGRDDSIKDSRAKEFGILMIIAIFFHSSDQELVKAKISIQNELTSILIKDKVADMPSVEFENLPLLLTQVKSHIQKSVKEGDRIIQEKAMDELMANQRLLYLGLYNSGTREFIANVIGEEDDFKEIVDETKHFNFDIFFTKFGDKRFGLINLQKYKKIIIIVLSNEDFEGHAHVFMEKDFMELYKSLYVASPLLEEYFG